MKRNANLALYRASHTPPSRSHKLLLKNAITSINDMSLTHVTDLIYTDDDYHPILVYCSHRIFAFKYCINSLKNNANISIKLYSHKVRPTINTFYHYCDKAIRNKKLNGY